jgi:hypothetical protein
VPEHERKLRLGEVTIDHMEIGTAHTAGVDPEEDLAGTRLWPGNLGLTQGPAGSVEQHRTHGFKMRGQVESGKRESEE